jgi:DnaK suppressor protein
MLVRRDVERFEQSCGGVDPDAKAAFKALLAADRPATPVAAAIARSPDAPPKEAAHKAEARPDAVAKQPAAKANLAAAPAQSDAAASDGQWLDAVRQALQTHGAQPPTAAIAKAPVAPAPAPVPAPRAVQQEAAVPVPAPAVAAPVPLSIAPELPPATSVATPAAPPADPDHPLPPASIPDPVPPTNADAATPAEQGRSRIGNWIAHVPLLRTVIENRWR